jgi:hypothetical protein
VLPGAAAKTRVNMKSALRQRRRFITVLVWNVALPLAETSK